MSVFEEGFKDSSNLTNWVRYLLYAQVLVAVVSILSGFIEYQLLSDYQEGVYTSEEQAVADGEASDQRQQIVGILYLAVFIISGILILKWIYRANYNARQLGAKNMDFTPGWSIGYYFIPILTLWKPYLAMREIWQASQEPSDWGFANVSPILPFWWALWILSGMLGQVILRFSLKAEELDELINLNLITQFSNTLDIPLALVTLAIINGIYKMQVRTLESANKSIPQTTEAAAD